MLAIQVLSKSYQKNFSSNGMKMLIHRPRIVVVKYDSPIDLLVAWPVTSFALLVRRSISWWVGWLVSMTVNRWIMRLAG